MSKKTQQQIFDYVAVHLLAQGERSAREDGIYASGVCLYRGPYGMSCAVGCLIPDALYSPELENIVLPPEKDTWSWGADRARPLLDVLEEAGLPKSTWRLLKDLQRVHDGLKPDAWIDELITTARAHGLSTEILGQ